MGNKSSTNTYSITAKLIFSILLFYIVLATIFLPWQMIIAYQREENALYQEMERLQIILRSGLANAAFHEEDEEVDLLLDSLLKGTDVLGLSMQRYLPKPRKWEKGLSQEAVTNMNYRSEAMQGITSGFWPILLSRYTHPIIQTFDLTREDAGKSTVIGEVQFYSNTALVIESVRKQFLTIFYYAFVRLTLLSFFLFYIGYWFLSRPLKMLTNATDAIAKGDFDSVRHKLEHQKLSIFQTEVDELLTSFQNMVSQVRAAQIETDKARAHLSEIFNTSLSALIAIDSTGIVTDWNTKAEQLTAMTRAQALGKPYEEAYPPLALFVNTIKKVLENHQSKELHKRHIRDRYYDISIALLENAASPGAVIRLDDVTDEVKLQEVAMQTEKMTSVGLLAAGMAHEINNPLGAVLQSAQNIGRRLDPDLEANVEAATQAGIDINALVTYLENRGIYRFLRSIKESGERAAKIVANLLQFSRRSAGSLQMLKPQEVINKSLQLALSEKRLFNSSIQPPIEIKTDFSDSLPYIMGNENELEQVMLNLIKNAGQALLESSKPRRQLLLRSYATKDAVIIEVTDNGPGMNDVIKNRIFEPFFTTKPIGEGTGLGLSICYRIVTESHNGKIYVESIPGIGSSFIVELPIWQAEEKEGPVSEK